MIYAVIPLRKGSKRVPNKNTRIYNGLPLWRWVYNAAKDSFPAVDQIVLLTDIPEIMEEEPFDHWERPPRLSLDTTRTEDTVYGWIQAENIQPEDRIVLLQATSPYTTAEDIEAAVALHAETGKDVLSAKRVSRFLWQERGRGVYPVNYLIHNRPRTQEFVCDYFVENGAIYISRASNYPTARITVPAEIYEMSEDFEIDTEKDFQEALCTTQQNTPTE